MKHYLSSIVEQRLHYCFGAYGDPATYQKLAAKLAEIEAAHHTGGNALFYIAKLPATVGPVIAGLHATGLLRETPLVWRLM